MKKFPSLFLLMQQGKQLRLRKEIASWTRRIGSYMYNLNWTSFAGVLGIPNDLFIKYYEEKTV